MAYGALLVFQTIRVGFPSARVVVVDNGSIPEILTQIESECIRVGAELVKQERQDFTNFYSMALSGGKDIAIVDPDVVFWESVEGWEFNALMAGRKIPDLVRYGVRSLARLHPSMIFIPDADKLQEEIERRTVRGINTIGQYSAYMNGEAVFWDTLAPIYQMMPNMCHEFTCSELDFYDHLFYGSHLLAIDAGLDDAGETLSYHIKAAEGNIEQLRGIWKAQEKWFLKKPVILPSKEEIEKSMQNAAFVLANASGVNHTGAVKSIIEEMV